MESATRFSFFLMSILSLMSVIGWSRILRSRGSATTRLLEMEPRTPVPWGLFDVVAVGFLWSLSNATAEMIVMGPSSAQAVPNTTTSTSAPPDSPSPTLSAPGVEASESTESRGLAVTMDNADGGREKPTAPARTAIPPRLWVARSLGSGLAWCAAVFWLRCRVHASRFDLGLSTTNVLGDIGLGCRAFVLIAPPVLLLQMGLVRVWHLIWPEQQHPVIEGLLADPSRQMYWAAAVAAVIAAPIWEELLFRGVLQGWLERLARQLREVHTAPDAFSEVLRDMLWGQTPGRDTPLPATSRPFRWPILASASMFAVAHWGHGPDPIPLFFLATGIGYVYERTHRILPCVVIHMLVNLTTMSTLWFVTV